ncbi:MAG: CopG family transcriptional regulator [Chloroflexi bacterium]|nr:CopG family transcriptional regulator [Chloroflexota bacterium]
MQRASSGCPKRDPRLLKRLEQAKARVDAGKGIRLEDVEDLAAFEERAKEPDLAFEDAVKGLNKHGMR